MSSAPHHFIDICDLESSALRRIIDVSRANEGRPGMARRAVPVEPDRPLDGKILAMIFERPSTRTRVSFDVAMRQLGGETLLLPAGDLQLGTWRDRGRYCAACCRAMSTPSWCAQSRMTNCASLPIMPACRS